MQSRKLQKPCEASKRQIYLKVLSEEKSIIARYADNYGIVNAIRQFLNDFPGNSLKESTISGWKKDYLKTLYTRKKVVKI